ncbi:DUF3196 family protein [Solibacillus isronensis]|uniref:DUF3196 family protein n=1 Tax=Solibacillus isronensis TaxID=412383 RepID=UPI0009A8DF0A|nr:DUF3196 family protein [Solibacillus isronensis]
MKENKKNKGHGKVILFPGMTDRLFNEAKYLAENNQYKEANELFEQALLLGEGDEMSLSIFAYSLYEEKNFERAKQVCEELLAIGPNMYFEVMELYLTICMQLRQFKQVEKIIESLFDEQLIPEHEVEKFERLKNLNAHIAENQESHFQAPIIEDDELEEFTATEFLNMSAQQQMMLIHELTEKNIRPYSTELKAIIENDAIQPFIKSLLLILLVEQEINMTVTVTKFDQSIELNPVNFPLPTKLPQYKEITEIIAEQLAQEPSTLEFAMHLIDKHAIVLYPYEWSGYSSEEVAAGYIEYVKTMFGEDGEKNGEIVTFLQNIEKMSDLQE